MRNQSLKRMIVALIVLIMTAIGFGSCAIAYVVSAEIPPVEVQDYLAQSDVKTNQYLVTDNYISRISPSTTVEEFKNQLGIADKKVTVYSDSKKTQEVTDKLVTTGMVVNVEGISVDYELSVIGDVNGDGVTNIIDAVQIINDLNFLEKRLTNLQLVSGDVNDDGKLNRDDVDRIIRYIVYEELEIGTVEAPMEPAIDVEGTENNGWFKENKEIVINTLEENFSETIYKVNGEAFDTTDKAEKVNLTESGRYRVSAYTYGEKKNKSRLVQRVVSIDKEAPVIEKIDKTAEGANNQNVRIDVTANDVMSGIAAQGYSFDNGATWQADSFKVYPQNSGEITILVRDNAGNIQNAKVDIVTQYDITFKDEDGTVLQSEKLNYGVMPAYKGETLVKAGDETYEYTFAGWDKEVVVVTESAEYTATYTQAFKNYEIIFKNEDGSIISQKADYHYGDTIVVPDEPTMEKIGYVCTFDKWSPDLGSGKVEKSEIYTASFNKELIEYNLSYELDGGAVKEGNPTTYNVETETFTLNNPTKKDYTFLGWTLDGAEVADGEETSDGTIEENPDETPDGTTEESPEKTPVQTVTIEKGSTGDRAYTAHWELSNIVAMIKETGKVYGSIASAQEEVLNGQTIIILVDVKESVVIDETLEVILDLNGFELSGFDDTSSTIDNKGILTIIDTSEEQTGMIINDYNYVINNEENATFTLGTLEDEVKMTPYLLGNETGIKNAGTLNFYDGTVEADRAIDGSVNDTPVRYSVKLDIDNKEDRTRQIATLGIMADSVARIDDIYYTSLQAALDSIENPNNMPEYSEQYSKKGLVMQLDESSYDYDNTWKDISGVSNTQVSLRAGTFDRRDNSMYLDGNTYFSIPALSGTKFDNGTAEILVQISEDFKPVSTDNWYQASCILGTELSGACGDWGIIIDKNGNFAVGYYNSATRKETIKSSTISALDGKPHTLTYKYMTNGIKFYVDGNLIATDEFTPTGTKVGTLGIGWNNSGTATKIKGKIYSVRYYNEELSQEDIEANLKADKVRFNERLVNQEQTTITILKDIGLIDKVRVKDYINANIDLNGKTISTINTGYLLRNDGVLELSDSSEEKTGTITSSSSARVIYNTNDGKLKLNDIALSSGKAGTSSVYSYIINNNGNLEINGTTLSSEVQYSGLIYNTNMVNMTAGYLNNTIRDTTSVYNTGDFKISGGTIENVGRYVGLPMYNSAEGNVSISGGSILSTYYDAIQNDGKINMSDGLVKGTCAISDRKNSSVIINGGELQGSSEAIYHESPGNIEMNGGTFRSTGSDTHAIRNMKAGIIKITGGTFAQTNNKYVVSNESTGNVEITGGTFTASGSYSIANLSTGNIDLKSGNFISNTVSAVYNGGNGNINIGSQEDELSTESPFLQGKTYGMYNANGEVNFYNGKIQGGTAFILGGISDVRKDYRIKVEKDETNNEIATLTQEKEENVSYKGNNYASIQEAVNVIVENEIKEESTIYLLKDNNITVPEEKVTIPEGYNITIDMNNHNITSLINDAVILNEGSLNIKETTELAEGEEKNGKLEAKYPHTIHNVGSLVIDGLSIKTDNNTNNSTISVVHNEGILNVIDLAVDVSSTTRKKIEQTVLYNDGTMSIDNINLVLTITEASGLYSNGPVSKGIYNNGIIEYIKAGSINAVDSGDSSATSVIGIYNDANGEIKKIGDSEGLLEIKTSSVVYWSGPNYNVFNAGKIGLIEPNATLIGHNRYPRGDGNMYTLYNDASGVIDEIKSKVIRIGGSNQAAIYNKGTITDIIGDIEQRDYDYLSLSKDCRAIYNSGTITNVTGNILMSIKGIENTGTGIIENITGTISADSIGVQNTGKINNLNSSMVYGVSESVENSGIITINDSNIGTKDDLVSNYGIYNKGGEKVIINNTTVTGKQHGIYNVGTTEIQINSGNIISTAGIGIENNTDTGIITLGENNQNTYPTVYPDEGSDIVYPIVRGITLGVYNKGIFNFYDGIIFAEETSKNTISGPVSATSNVYDGDVQTEEKYDVLYRDTETEHYAILGREVACQILDEADNVLKDYYSLESAINDYQNNSELTNKYKIKILRDISIKEADKTLVIAEDEEVVLDFNGYKITAGNEIPIENLGTLSLINTNVENAATITTTNKKIINNKGTLNIDNVNMLMDIAKEKEEIITIDNEGTLNIISSNMKLTNSGDSNTLRVLKNTGTVNATDLTLDISITGKNKLDSAGIYNEGTMSIDNINLISDSTNIVGIISNGPKYKGIYNNGIIEYIKTGNVTVLDDSTALYAASSAIGIYNDVNGEIKRIGDSEGLIEVKTVSATSYSGPNYDIFNAGKIGLIDSSATIIGDNRIWSGNGTIYSIYNDASGIIDEIKGKVIRLGDQNQAAIYNKGTITDIIGDIEQKVSRYPELCKDSSAINNAGTITNITGNVLVAQKGIINSGTIENITGTVSADLMGIKNSGTINNLNSEFVYGPTRALENTGKVTINGGTIGRKDNLISPEGIYSTNELTYNAGEIYGKTKAVTGVISAIPEGKQLNREDNTEAGYIRYYLEDATLAVSLGETQYNTINEAIAAATEENNTIVLLRDIMQVENINIDEGKEIIIDLNGFSIDGYSLSYMINNNGKLILKSTQDGSKISSAQGIVNNTSELVLENIAMDISLGGNSSANNSMVLNNSANATVNVENVSVDSAAAYMNVINNLAGTVNFNRGTINLTGAKTNIICNEDKVIINNGKFTTTATDTNHVIYNKSNAVTDGNVQINNIELNTNYCGIRNDGKSSVTINGGNFTTTNREIIYHNSTGNVVINDGTFRGNGTGSHMILNKVKGNVTVTGGEFSTDKDVHIIANESTGNVYIEGGTLINKIKSTIYNVTSGNIIVGKNDGTVSIDNPIIRSDAKIGIYNPSSGKISFFDGAIIGKTGAIYGTIYEIPDGYRINNEIVDIDDAQGLEKYTLILDGTDTSEASCNGIHYKTLQAAIDSCGSTETTITLQKDVNTEDIIKISSEKVIKLDLNGFKIKATIENNGTLQIINSKGTVEDGSYGTITGDGTVNM